MPYSRTPAFLRNRTRIGFYSHKGKIGRRRKTYSIEKQKRKRLISGTLNRIRVPRTHMDILNRKIINLRIYSLLFANNSINIDLVASQTLGTSVHFYTDYFIRIKSFTLENAFLPVNRQFPFRNRNATSHRIKKFSSLRNLINVRVDKVAYFWSSKG